MTEGLNEFVSLPGWNWYFSAMVFFFGACWGSFLNVCIWRIPREESVVHPPSHCPGCETRIAWFDNIPVVSWLVLGAKCRSCKTRISPRYISVEIITGLLFLLVWFRYGVDPRTPVYWLVLFGLLLGTFVDLDHMWIPDRVTWGGIILGLLISPLVPGLHGVESAWPSLMRSATGAVVGFGLLWTVSAVGKLIFKQDAMGFGDVKLAGTFGAFLGWKLGLLSIFFAALFGSILGICWH